MKQVQHCSTRFNSLKTNIDLKEIPAGAFDAKCMKMFKKKMNLTFEERLLANEGPTRTKKPSAKVCTRCQRLRNNQAGKEK